MMTGWVNCLLALLQIAITSPDRVTANSLMGKFLLSTSSSSRAISWRKIPCLRTALRVGSSVCSMRSPEPTISARPDDESFLVLGAILKITDNISPKSKYNFFYLYITYQHKENSAFPTVVFISCLISSRLTKPIRTSTMREKRI